MTAPSRLVLSDDDLTAAHRSGKNDREISDSYGVSRSTVKRRRQGLGLPANVNRAPIQKAPATPQRAAPPAQPRTAEVGSYQPTRTVLCRRQQKRVSLPSGAGYWPDCKAGTCPCAREWGAK